MPTFLLYFIIFLLLFIIEKASHSCLKFLPVNLKKDKKFEETVKKYLNFFIFFSTT